MNNWIETDIGNLVELKQGLAINKQSKHLLVNKSDLPLLRITDMINNQSIQFIDPIKVPKNVITDGSEIIFTRTGQVGLVFKGRKGVVHNNCFKVIPSNKLDNDYLYYYLKQPAVELYFNNVASGSVQKDLNHGAFNSLSLIYPNNLKEQKQIAKFLSVLDDKIILLRQQNETLEALTQLLFRRWFVDFEFPDKDEKPYKSNAGRMVESELGEIPEGWDVSSLKELTEKISKGTTPTQMDMDNSIYEISFLKVKDISDDGNINYGSIDKIPKVIHLNNLKRSILQEDDVLYSIAGTIGRVTILPSELANSNCNQALAFIRLKDKKFFLEYIYLWLKSKRTKVEIESNIVQGVQANVSLGVLGDLKITVPNGEIMRNWNLLIKPLFKKYSNGQKQIQTLTQLRDTLLPKLMSGEVRVKTEKL